MELQNNYERFDELEAAIVGISMDAVPDTNSLSKLLGINYRLLSDPDGKIVKKYGVYNTLGDGVATPSVFIIGTNRQIEWSYVGQSIADRPNVDEIINNLR